MEKSLRVSHTLSSLRAPVFLLLTILLLPALACQAFLKADQATATPTQLSDLLPAATQTAPATTLAQAATLTPPTPTSIPPSTTPTPAPPTATALPSPTPSPIPSDLQLQVFESLWQAVNEDYLYPDFNGLDWQAIHEEYRQRIEAGLSNEEFYLAMDEMIYRLGDDHSIFLSPSEGADEDARLTGEYDYIGIGVLNSAIPERQRVTIILVFPGSPAEQAGLAAHDSILAVDGEPILDEDGLRRTTLQGVEGTTVTLTVQTPGQEPRQVVVTRRRINGEMPVPYEIVNTPDGKRIGYILVATFNDSTVGKQVKEALLAMTANAPIDGLILDDRLNGGGVNTVFRSTLMFFTHGVLGYFVNRLGEQPLTVIGENVNGSQDVPLVVLVGGETASFGEIFAGILKDISRAYLIGEPTKGNVEILWVYDFADGSRAWIAHDSFRPYYHSDQYWEQTGVKPDRLVRSRWDEVILDTDPVVHAALDYFDGR